MSTELSSRQEVSSEIETQGEVVASPRRRRSVARFTLPTLLVIITAVFTLAPATSISFPTAANLQAMVGSNAVLAIAAIALVLPLLAGQFDLSVGANVGLASVVVAALFGHGAPLAVAVIGGIVAGTLVGVVNGFFVAVAGVNSFIVTLGFSTVIAGAVLAYTEGQSLLEGVPESMSSLASSEFVGLPRVTYIVIAVALVMWYLQTFTPFGRSLRAVGANVQAARLVGLNVKRLTFLSFVASGALCGLAGILQVAQAGGASPQVGPGYLLPAFAAAFLGATVSRTNGFNVGGTVIAVVFVAVSVSGLVLSGVQPWVEQVFQGGVLVIAVTLSTLVLRRSEGAGN